MNLPLFTSVFPQTSILTTTHLKKADIFSYREANVSSIYTNDHRMGPPKPQHLGLCSMVCEAAAPIAWAQG